MGKNWSRYGLFKFWKKSVKKCQKVPFLLIFAFFWPKSQNFILVISRKQKIRKIQNMLKKTYLGDIYQMKYYNRLFDKNSLRYGLLWFWKFCMVKRQFSRFFGSKSQKSGFRPPIISKMVRVRKFLFVLNRWCHLLKGCAVLLFFIILKFKYTLGVDVLEKTA